MKRQVDYMWRLREIMAAHGMFQTTEFVQPLRDRGIDLSASQVHRLVTGKPERLSLAVLAALCDIFNTGPDDGYICAGCFATACETYGRCATCRVDRLVPGIADNGDRLCIDCAGGLGDYTCQRCGEEGWREHVGTCGRCVLRDRLAEVLDDGTGHVGPELAPFYEQVYAMSRPRSGILWLNKPHVPPISPPATCRSPTQV